MNCVEAEKQLSLEDGNARLDRDALAAHFRNCERCADRFPEIPALLNTLSRFAAPGLQASGRSTRASMSAWMAAAALLLLTAALLLRVDSRVPHPVQTAARSAPLSIHVRRLPATVSTVEHRTIRTEPNHQFSTTTRRQSFRPGLDRLAHFSR